MSDMLFGVFARVLFGVFIGLLVVLILIITAQRRVKP